jgi:hypothetical protein
LEGCAGEEIAVHLRNMYGSAAPVAFLYSDGSAKFAVATKNSETKKALST